MVWNVTNRKMTLETRDFWQPARDYSLNRDLQKALLDIPKKQTGCEPGLRCEAYWVLLGLRGLL